MASPKDRKPDITKFCLNCGKKIERKNFSGRIEDYAIYSRRKFCDHGCYVTMKKKTARPKPEPVAPVATTKIDLIEILEEVIETAVNSPDRIASFPVITEGEPLDAEAYLHNIMNDHRLSASRRDNAAKLLITGKAKVPVKGKKDERADKASNVASGNRFAPAAPPSKIAGRIG